MVWNQTSIRLLVDASAAKNSSERARVGRMRPLQIEHMWLQEWVRLKIVKSNEVGTENNAADVQTIQAVDTVMTRILLMINFTITNMSNLSHQRSALWWSLMVDA